MTFLAAYASFVVGVRVVLLWVAVAAGLICVVDWLVRTRRISPFSSVARFFRSRIDPLVAPVERAQGDVARPAQRLDLPREDALEAEIVAGGGRR